MPGPQNHKARIAILGAGLAGCVAALELARAGQSLTLIDRNARPMMGASRHNEGKLHLGYVYAADTRLETHRILAEGSLSFLDTLERLTGHPRDRFSVSEGFTYIVPDTSARTPDEIWTYFNTVDDTVTQLCAQLSLPPLRRAEAAAEEFCKSHYADCVHKAYHTPEIAVDPGEVSDVVAAAIYAHPLITFLGGKTVMDVNAIGSSDYRIRLTDETDETHLHAVGVINALWEDRLRIDKMVGLPSSGV